MILNCLTVQNRKQSFKTVKHWKWTHWWNLDNKRNYDIQLDINYGAWKISTPCKPVILVICNRIMFFMFFVTSVLSSEYMVNLLMRAGLMMFLGPENVEMNFNTQINNDTQDLSGLEDPLYNGTYYYVSSDNFENYLTELGVGYFLRKLALLAFPIITVTR